MIDETAIEFHIGVPALPERLKTEASERILELAEDHSDIVGALVEVERPAHGKTAFIHEARVVLYMRPDNVVAKEKAETIQGALKGALAAAERQARERREKLGEPWKRPDMRDQGEIGAPRPGEEPISPPEPSDGGQPE
jgi:ribosome-associated translation inhibitor RaiA